MFNRLRTIDENVKVLNITTPSAWGLSRFDFSNLICIFKYIFQITHKTYTMGVCYYLRCQTSEMSSSKRYGARACIRWTWLVDIRLPLWPHRAFMTTYSSKKTVDWKLVPSIHIGNISAQHMFHLSLRDDRDRVEIIHVAISCILSMWVRQSK